MNDNYETILESGLMDEIWSKLDATTKIEVLEKSGWSMVEEYIKRVGENNEQLEI